MKVRNEHKTYRLTNKTTIFNDGLNFMAVVVFAFKAFSFLIVAHSLIRFKYNYSQLELSSQWTAGIKC